MVLPIDRGCVGVVCTLWGTEGGLYGLLGVGFEAVEVRYRW